ncbi:FAD dependent oxidoreductase, partial [Oryctes borbonicus]
MNLGFILLTHGFIPCTLYTNTTLSYNSHPPLIKPAYTSERWDDKPQFGAIHSPNSYTEKEYDFIIVGSGPAGCVITNRLSENPAWNVLLLEAGKEPSVITEIPAITSYFLLTDYNWGYLTQEQENMALGLVERRMHWPRGKVLGGSSVINAMIHFRGNRIDFDRWSENGNRGWSYDELLPYFLKSEDYHVKFQDPGYHHQGGYLHVEDVPYRSKSAEAFVEAMQEMGVKYVDYNGKNQSGVSYMHATTRNGRRCSAFNSLLEPIRKRKNLKIYTSARVIKIMIDKDTKHAWGVKYVKDKRLHIAKARKEIIISAGALSSPQLLMLSGIGPEDHLTELGIPVMKNLPVGLKLYDHLAFYGLTATVNESITIPFDDLYHSLQPLQEYIQGRGILATLTGAEALGIIRTPLAEDSYSDYPDIEYIFLGNSAHADKGEFFRKIGRITDEVYNAIWKPLEGRQAFTILPMLYHPKSYGYLRLKSKNPYHWPKFYGNYLTDPENLDVRTFIASIRIVQKLLQMPSFKKYNAKLVETPAPGCEEHNYDSDAYWECSLRHLSST